MIDKFDKLKQQVLQHDCDEGNKAENKLFDFMCSNGLITEKTGQFCWNDFKVNGLYNDKRYLVEHKRPEIH